MLVDVEGGVFGGWEKCRERKEEGGDSSLNSGIKQKCDFEKYCFKARAYASI